jgi:DNA repair exonuclease SbcCD ATPase subunit
VRQDGSISDVPVDAFRIEYFGQGELAKIAEDPLKIPQLFQEFLDRHTSLRDLIETEKAIVISLQENAGRLNPLESAFAQLTEKRATLKEIETKLKIAEEGNLRGVVGVQSKLASEKAVRESVESVAATYTSGFTLAGIHRDFDQIVKTAGVCTTDAASMATMAAMKTEMLDTNAVVSKIEAELNTLVRASAQRLVKLANGLKASHQRMSGEIATKIADLKASGVATDIPGLEALLRQKTSVATEIAAVEQRSGELKKCREQRVELRDSLKLVRQDMTDRRKAQLKNINANLGAIIKDYTIFVRYDDAGINSEFEAFLQDKMRGTYLQDNSIQTICSKTTPSDLADWTLGRDYSAIANATGITADWAERIVDKLCYWRILFDLQALAKQPKPIITVRTKSTPPKNIPVLQLSDGQRHTILLTIAMLAESNVPLVIDQPEDDLDNAFIFSSIVSTLRAIKERRQVIVVTHNANIAVLGDSELILPMHRENDFGKTKDRGSIDASATKDCVLSILEGGPDAFQRRREMYDH